MNKLANVVYAYSPKNDDELELKVGDKIEVIGFEEEGWWKGRLKGRVGVFPSNFVQIIESSSPTTHSIISSPPTPITTPANKLNLLGNKISKTSLSSNSLNSNNSNSNSNSNNNNNNNNNLMMNNTQHQDNSGLVCGEDPPITSSEKRPKPIRGVGYGDIFASSGKSKPLPADPTSHMANERLSTIANTLQKQIPKKPPPPAPTMDNSNGTSTDQAPALPPKPANQFSPHLQHSRPLPSTQQQQHHQQQQQHQSTQHAREQARVIYAYEPLNDDELAMEVGDIIDIIDKDIEDLGWWKGELRGKVGVFPDNFVQLIDVPETQRDWHPRAPNTNQPVTSSYNQSTEGKIKSVFAATPKGFSKELETNLEKHNGPASFLSLKRSKQQMSSESDMNENGKRDDIVGLMETNTTKLNHITANRTKGPSRRPPSNVLNKRNQLDLGKRESNGRDDLSLGSLPINSTSQSTTNDLLTSLPTGQLTTTSNTPIAATITTPTIGHFSSKPNDGTSSNPLKPSLSLDNVIDNQPLTPKTSQRLTQPTALDKTKTASTPPWMVELKKAHAEKKRDSPIVNVLTQEDKASTAKVPFQEDKASTAKVPLQEDKISTSKVPFQDDRTVKVPFQDDRTVKVPFQDDRTVKVPFQDDRTAKVSDVPSLPNNVVPTLSNAQYDKLLEQISKNVNSEISQLREEVKRLREDFHGIAELKSALEVMKIELKSCQSATDNQKKYIKDLINNLADERKKIAAMQTEIDRNLK